MLVFFIVMNALAHQKKGGKTNMSTVVALYLIGTFLAAFTAVVASFAFPSTLLLDASAGEMAAPGGIGEVLKNLLMNAVSNPVASLVNANYIGILMWPGGASTLSGKATISLNHRAKSAVFPA